MPVRIVVCVALILLSACKPAPPAPAPAVVAVETANGSEESGAISVGKAATRKEKIDLSKTTEWPNVPLTAGVTQVSCELDYSQGDGQPLDSLDFLQLADAIKPCKQTGVVRLRYTGKINAEFTALMERVSNIAQRMDIQERVLDISSSGGQVEDAIRAGDIIGASQWTLWVREDAICHSSCVLILAAGDQRVIAGRVGIHRMMRINSKATTRAELSQELREVYAQLKDYLERNGAAVTIADLMMTVPNRKLRLLDNGELMEYGLQGANAAQDDLDRIRLTRDCGEDFVRRRDEFLLAFTRRCGAPGFAVEEMNACGLALRGDYGFPDQTCPHESPLAEFDRRLSARGEREKAESLAAPAAAGSAALVPQETLEPTGPEDG
ncbi:hypothetical protein [Pseudoxanthomonas dokdonensis]|uniref:Lipoprotein n=1 Tax=Pseudoxanthomonas dokdonensis TaxID=344882 RepID=A0A0R0CQQ9_9GAMM|nr:hypothetical protein [Pseudoxanthomonas dokdonensis]KRG68206.1 hypothetical protein ABB29_14275 [Pseudoxanthomonas dokdonensis]